MTDKSKLSLNLSRRQTLAGAIGTAALGTSALATSVPGLAHDPAKKPNILFIMADDLGFADLSCYGRGEYQTPVVDKLAAQGMKFNHAYANSAVCTATRVALITGRYQYRLEVGNQEPLGDTNIGLDPAHPTLPSLMQEQGYHTALVGKWHLGNLPDFGPLKSGYDEFWGIRQGGVDYFTHKIYDRNDLWDGETLVEDQGYLTHLLADRTVGMLEERAAEPDKPWLISLHLTAPHWPWETPDDTAESARLDSKESAAGLAIAHYDGGDMETYAAMVTDMDEQIGRVLDKLKALNMEQDTIVVFTSDNGGERFSDTWPFTGKKTELLEGGLRIPAIVRWPGRVSAGSESDQPIMSMDWMPTFLGIAGGAMHPDHPTDGLDITPALAGHPLAERTLYWRFGNKNQKAVRRGNDKFLSINDNEFLFDIVKDPLERGNLAERRPERHAELKRSFEQWNTTMLHLPDAPSYGFNARQLADHFGMDD